MLKIIFIIQHIKIEIENSPINFEIVSVYPNPFNPISNIKFDLSKSSDITINIYNLNGNRFENVFYSNMCEGTHMYSWDASNFASGIYFVQILTNYGQLTHKLALVK